MVVRNHHAADLRIYVVTTGGTNHRLGIVPRFGVATLVVPSAIRLPAELRFVAMPLGPDEPQVTEPILVEAGTELVFTVENDAPASTLTKRL